MQNLLCRCSKIATAMDATATTTASVLFQTYFISSIAKFFSIFLQAYCHIILPMKFELLVTCNYAYVLSTRLFEIKQTFIKLKLKWMLMQIIIKMH